MFFLFFVFIGFSNNAGCECGFFLRKRVRGAGGKKRAISDCSEQSGWVSSAVSSRHSDGTPPHTHFCNDEPPYPELEPIPLAPPEEFQVLIDRIFFFLQCVKRY